MKIAVKVLSIISIIGGLLGAIIFFAIQGAAKQLVQEEFEAGRLVVNGTTQLTQAEVDTFKGIVAGVMVFFGILCLLTIVLHALNIYFSSKDNKTGILVIAIVDFVFGSFILAVLNFLDYLDIGKQKRVEELEVKNLE
jgi:fluoride ion exporter CrcB/FEX